MVNGMAAIAHHRLQLGPQIVGPCVPLDTDEERPLVEAHVKWYRWYLRIRAQVDGMR